MGQAPNVYQIAFIDFQGITKWHKICIFFTNMVIYQASWQVVAAQPLGICIAQ